MIIFVRNKNSFFGKRAFFDPEYLAELHRLAQKVDADFERISDDFDNAVSNLRIGGTYKKTSRGRLKQTEKYLFDFAEKFPAKDVKILDLGGSDGTTSLELAKTLQKIEGKKIEIHLADISFCLKRFRYGFLREYRAENGEPILMKLGKFGLVLSKHRHEFDYRTKGLAKKYLELNLRKNLKPNDEISLLNPFVLKSNSVIPKTLNCLNFSPELIEKYGAIRASNILHSGYFTFEKIAIIIKNLHYYLQNGGFLVISRNHENNEDNGSIWQKDGNKFVWRKDFGKGSEIKDLVNNFEKK